MFTPITTQLHDTFYNALNGIKREIKKVVTTEKHKHYFLR